MCFTVDLKIRGRYRPFSSHWYPKTKLRRTHQGSKRQRKLRAKLNTLHKRFDIAIDTAERHRQATMKRFMRALDDSP